MGGGNLASNSKKKGFAISGILYPLLILTLFLVVQMLFMLQTRKNVLDKARTELADTVNKANTIYTNEELSALVNEQQEMIKTLQNQLATYVTKTQLSDTKQNILDTTNKALNDRLHTYIKGTGEEFSCGYENAAMRKFIESKWEEFPAGFSAPLLNDYGCDYMALVNKTSNYYGTVILTGYSWNSIAIGNLVDLKWTWSHVSTTQY